MSGQTLVGPRPRPGIGPGVQLNDLYEVDRLIAVGGMGEIYEGHVIETGDKVAIKTIRPDLAESATALALFRKEASALHTVHHGAVVRYFVFSIDRRLELPYLAMEYVTGQSLAEVVKAGPLPIRDLEILRERLATGLQAAHEAGIVHRDISPDNVILPGGDPARAKIIDFGIARSLVAEHTVIGEGFAGKYSYVSPEQLGLQGGQVTPRSDIYGLGLVLAEAALGRRLDMGDTPAACIARRSAIPDLAGVDARLRPLLEAMLRPDPKARPDSMAAVAAWRPAVAAPPAPPRPPRAGRRWAGAAAGLALCAAAGVAFLLTRPDGTGPATPGGSGLLEERAREAPAVTPTTEISTTLPSAPEAPDTPAERPAPESPPPAVTPPAPVPRPQPAAAPADPVAAYIRGYRGGPCFYLDPRTTGARSEIIEAFGAVAEPFAAFDAAFTAALGFESQIELRQVDRPQCPVVEALARQPAEREALSPRLTVDRDRLRGGEALRGSIELAEGTEAELMLVDGDGVVHNLSPYLVARGRRATFTVPLDAAANRERPQLVVALSARERPTFMGDRRTARADSLFPAIVAAASRPNSSLGLAVRYVKVGT